MSGTIPGRENANINKTHLCPQRAYKLVKGKHMKMRNWYTVTEGDFFAQETMEA